MTSLHKLHISECLQGLKKKHFSITELIQDHVQQIKSQKKLNAFISAYCDESIKKAQNLDQKIHQIEDDKNALMGIPISIKDIYCIEGTKTTCASKMLENFVPDYTATSVEKLLNQNAIIIGKTNLDEFAMGSSTSTGVYGYSVNPWSENINDPLTSGGSSGGSAVSVSAFMSMASLGTDTGGSVRQPASLTGIVGLKPSYGRISRWGFAAFASSLDHVGIFSRSVEDAAIILTSVQGVDVKDATSQNLPKEIFESNLSDPITGLKIGIIKELKEFQVSSCVQKMQDEFCKTLQKLGAEIIEISIPNLKNTLATYYIISCCESSSNLSRYDGMRFTHRTTKDVPFDEMVSITRSEGFGDEVKTRILLGTYLLSSGFMEDYYIQAQKVRRMIYNDLQNAFSDIDALILPTSPTDAFKINEISSNPTDMYNNDIFTTIFNLSGSPAISIPAKLSKKGLPLGMQIAGPMYSEKLILQIAYAVENTLDTTLFKNKLV